MWIWFCFCLRFFSWHFLTLLLSPFQSFESLLSAYLSYILESLWTISAVLRNRSWAFRLLWRQSLVFILRHDSESSTAFLTFHFLPVSTSESIMLTIGSGEWRSITNRRNLMAFHAPPRDLHRLLNFWFLHIVLRQSC